MLVRNSLIAFALAALSLTAFADGPGGWDRGGDRGGDHGGGRGGDHGGWDHGGGRGGDHGGGDHGGGRGGDHGGQHMKCVAKNNYGGTYFGEGNGREAYKLASDEAMINCMRGSSVPNSCQIDNCWE